MKRGVIYTRVSSHKQVDNYSLPHQEAECRRYCEREGIEIDAVFIERGENPDFDSIPAAMWWGIVTLTTVGYGDIAPVTPLGKAFGACVAILGIGMFAIPAGVLGAAFSEHMSERRKSGR